MMERKNSIVKKLTDGISGLFVGNKVDSILAGLSEQQVNRRKCIVVDKDDFIISNSFA